MLGLLKLKQKNLLLLIIAMPLSKRDHHPQIAATTYGAMCNFLWFSFTMMIQIPAAGATLHTNHY